MRQLVFVFVVLFAVVSIDALSCKDQAGKDVDWFVAYKLPKLSTYPDVPLMKEGTAFLYMDAKTKKSGWKMTTVGIDKKDQAIGYTLQQVYDNLNSPDHFHMMYNDEHGEPTTGGGEGKSDGYRAHAKGVAVFNKNDGVWLIHSIPAFPPPDAYGFKDKSRSYGQSIMCVTFNTTKSFGELTEQWYRYHVSIYASRLPIEFAQKYPPLVQIVASDPPANNVSLSRIANLQSKGGFKLMHFAKNRKWNQDLYAKLVAPELKSTMYVETWLRGLGDLKSGCPIPPEGQQTVWNVREVSPGQIKYGSGNDHSKWAVSEMSGVGYTCIGDINRQKSQFERGGGTMCFKDSDVWNVYRNTVTQRELCVPDGEDGKQATGKFEPVGQ